MIPSLKLLLELHFNQILIVIVGFILANRLFRLSQKTSCLASVYTLGILWFSIAGAIALKVPKASITIWALTILLSFLLYRKSEFNLKTIFNNYIRLCFLPFLVFLPFGIFLLSHFSSIEIDSGIDPWVLADRTMSYRVPDHYLQWIVSDNFYSNKKIETGFNLNGKQMWSAGDRPVLIGLLDATFSQLTQNHSISLYYLRVIFISSLIFLTLYSILRDEFEIISAWKRYLILIFIALHPFFLINIIFTWPKMAGLSFGMMGFSLVSRSLNSCNYRLACLAGIAFALGILCHTAALFCLLATLMYLVFSHFLVKKELRLSMTHTLKIILAMMLPLIILTQIHSKLLSRVTKQTNLLARVQLCRGGSYAFVTPVESVLESCKKYYHRVGITGAIDDRIQSFQRAFDFRPRELLSSYMDALSSTNSLVPFLQSLNTPILLLVPYTIGHLSLYFIIILASLYLLSLKLPILTFSKSSLLAPIGLALLIVFCCMLAEYSEMSSHVVPYVIPLFIHLGILVELSRMRTIIFASYTCIGILISVAILLSRLSHI